MNFKLALATAAVLGLAGTAQAADLAKKAPAAANYVKVCDAYGAGYFYIPGSDTCLKIGGYARFQLDAFDNNRAGNLAVGASSPFGNSRSQNQGRTLARADITLDARTATELGLLRSFVEATFDNFSYGTAWGNGSNAGQAATAAYLNQAFIQFAGLTAGRAESFFDFFTSASPAFTLTSTTGPVADKKVNLLAYTFAFGNGISASLSIEDASTAGNGNVGYSDSRRQGYLTGGFSGFNTYGGVHTPDLVANVNITQAWGAAQIMGVLHDDYDISGAGKVGWAVGAGVTVNLPMLAAGDVFSLQGTYGQGATNYVSNYNGLSDYYYNSATNSIEQTKAWNITAGLHHDWVKTLGSSLVVAYTNVDGFNSTAANVQDRKLTDVRGNLSWKPVTGLAITGEVDYLHTDYATNTATQLDRDGWTGSLRIQRSF